MRSIRAQPISARLSAVPKGDYLLEESAKVTAPPPLERLMHYSLNRTEAVGLGFISDFVIQCHQSLAPSMLKHAEGYMYLLGARRVQVNNV